MIPINSRLVLLIAALCSAVFGGNEILPYNPVANPQAVVVSGNARFTVLTDRLIRMEYSKSGSFVDKATVAFLNRNLPVPNFNQTSQGGKLTIETKSLKLTYVIGSSFSASTLGITSKNMSPSFSWSHGMSNPKQLFGTIRTLDELGVISLNCSQVANVKIHDEYLHCAMGVMSRSGWAVVDDQENWMLTSNDWWDAPNTNDADLYFFGHGYDYTGALKDFIEVSGKVAMVPKYATGIWWSRWFNYNDHDVRAVVEDYRMRSLPLDVYVLDMDWHTKQAWGTYSFDKRLFPIPAMTMAWLHSQGLATTVNLHDDSGVGSFETEYAAMARALGMDPSRGTPIAFDIVNSTVVYALEDIVLQNLQAQGVDFWWIDWQQGGTQGGAAGRAQNPTIWLNKVRGTDHIRRNNSTRGIILARYGGLGSQRYQVGFSGDVKALTWANFAFQPYFSLTAANVAFGFWSHDLVGPATDHELHTRWLQFGAFSGVFRTHDRGMASGSCANNDPSTCAIVEIWNVPQRYFLINRAAVRARAALIPYIYNATRTAFDTGISLLRPLYYEFPEFDNAYNADPSGAFAQYMFGDHIIAAPVTVPADNTSMASTTLWVPPGTWLEGPTGTLRTGASDGSSTLQKYWDLREIPLFYRAGAIIPQILVTGRDLIGNARRGYSSLVVVVVPGATKGETVLYEDDGETTAYLQGVSGRVHFSYSRTGARFELSISHSGSFPQRPATRSFQVRLLNSLPLVSVTVNGSALSYGRFGGPGHFWWDSEDFAAVFETQNLPTSNSLAIVAQTARPTIDAEMSGMKGIVGHANWAKENLDMTWTSPGSTTVTGGVLSELASAGELLSFQANEPSQFDKTLAALPAQLVAARNELNKMLPPGPRALVQFYDASRQDNCLCGSDACRVTNNSPRYQFMRVEGFGADPQDSGAIPLNMFWDQAITDNWATPAAEVHRSGYIKGVFGNGHVYSYQPSNVDSVALSLWWSEARKDMLTVASPAGVQYAKDNNYQLLNATMAWVLRNPPLLHQPQSVNDRRVLYSLTLLASASV